MAHYKLISSTKASDVIPVKKYVSEKTGITVIIANVAGPLVSGYFCLATEAHDDDGLPHTLEHLIFLGSKRYPYKGILDLLANRCMAHGTNAWTDTDHTCYTIDTAGDEGMLTLIPIYLDHILHPTLTEEGFVTEVHHIDGEGTDAGVVYCEMQGRENSDDSRCNLKLLREMYPNSGYSSETGGIMKNLRTSTDNAKVRAFHKKFYRPENLTVILTGQIEAEDVFKALAVVEDDIIANSKEEQREPWTKPWQSVPPPPRCGESREQWPADTEDCGQVLFGWRGPLLTAPRAPAALSACAVLLRYLCDTAAAPLQRCLVEREDALAGDVSYNLTENMSVLITIILENVPVGSLEAARDAARECLNNVVSGKEPLDMERLRRLVRKQLRENTASLESDPHHALAFRCIGDALYSRDEHDFQARMNPEVALRELLTEAPEYWLGILQEFFTDQLVTVLGSPSIELMAKMAKEESDRIEKQRTSLGAAGLADKANKLKEAIEFNERPPPAGVLASVPVPGCSFRCHQITTFSTDGERCPQFNLDDVPIYTRVHSLSVNFVYINLILDTTTVDEETRKWLPLLRNGLASCPVWRGGKLVPHDDVISSCEELMVRFGSRVGVGDGGNFSVGGFSNFVMIEAMCEPKDYEEVVNLIYEVVFEPELTRERLLVFVQRLINDISNVRRKGDQLVRACLRDALYRPDTNVHWGSILRQLRFLKQILEKLSAGGDTAEQVLKDVKRAMGNIREKVWLHLATDLERFTLSTEPWKRFRRENEVEGWRPQLYRDADLLSGGGGGGFVVGCGGVESNFLAQSSPGPLGFQLDELAPLILALAYFTQLEGPMWRLIRGCGLSYGYGVRPAELEGRIMFSLYRATNPGAAYCKAKQIMEEYLSSGAEFDSDLFVSARSAAIFEVVEKEKCPAGVVHYSLENYLRQVDECYHSQLVCALASATKEQAAAAARRWLPPLFQPTKCTLSLVTSPSKVAELQEEFNKIGVKLEAYPSIEASHFNN